MKDPLLVLELCSGQVL